MAVWLCGGCGTRYSVGAPACPQCGANDPREEPTTGPVLPSVTVACPNEACPERGKERWLVLRQPLPGVVEKPPLHCAECGWQLAEVTEQEQGDSSEEDTDVAKISRTTGISNEGLELDPDTESHPVVEGPSDIRVERTVNRSDDPERWNDPTERGEQPSRTPEGAGTTSSTSSEKEPTSPETNKSEAPSPAPKTGSRSAKGRTGTSTARGTDGAQTAPSSDRPSTES